DYKVTGVQTCALPILISLGYLAYTGVQESKSYYVTINELNKMGDNAYTKRLRVGGNVQPGSIHQVGTNADFVLIEQDPATPNQKIGRASCRERVKTTT